MILPNLSKIDSMSSSSSEPCHPQSSLPVEPEEDTRYVTHECDSSENEDEKVINPSHRSWTMMWTFSTPRSYLKTFEERRQANELIPRDISREELAKKFLNAMEMCRLRHKLSQMIIVSEPHKKLQPDSLDPEIHYHVCFRMKSNFAHLNLANTLAQHQGMQGHMSYPRKGWPGMMKYVLMESAVKLPVHLDPNPLFWPRQMTKEEFIQKMRLRDDEVMKKGTDENKLHSKGEKLPTWKVEWNKKRKHLDFSDFADYVIQHKITNEQEFWKVALKEKEAGNPALWNYAGIGNVARQIQKCNRGLMAQFRDDVFQGTSKSTSKYPLSAFEIPHEILVWMKYKKEEKSLIIQGEGGLGKTEMARAILASMGKYFFVDSLDTVKSLLFTGNESILFDDISLHTFTVDEVKSFLDIQCERAVKCRHEDGYIPANTVRIFLTNHDRHSFFPREVNIKDHATAIDRRMIWVNITQKLFTLSNEKNASEESETQKEIRTKVPVECKSVIPGMDDLEKLERTTLSNTQEPSVENTLEGHEHFPEDDEMFFDGDEEAAMFMGHSDQDACRDSPGSSKGLPFLSSEKQSPAESKEFHQKQEEAAKMMVEEETKKNTAGESTRIEKDISSTHNHEDRAVHARMENYRVMSYAENISTPLVRYRKKTKPNPPWHNSEHRRRDVRWGTSHRSWRPWQ